MVKLVEKDQIGSFLGLGNLGCEFLSRSLAESPQLESTDTRSHKPHDSKNNLHDQDGSSLGTSVSTEGVESAPFAAQR